MTYQLEYIKLSVLENSKNLQRKNKKPIYINQNITNSKIRLIGSSGSQLGIYPPEEALKMAQTEGLDLVMISDQSDPPVCRIIDYGKYKFTQEKKQKKHVRNNTM